MSRHATLEESTQVALVPNLCYTIARTERYQTLSLNTKNSSLAEAGLLFFMRLIASRNYQFILEMRHQQIVGLIPQFLRHDRGDVLVSVHEAGALSYAESVVRYILPLENTQRIG